MTEQRIRERLIVRLMGELDKPRHEIERALQNLEDRGLVALRQLPPTH